MLGYPQGETREREEPLPLLAVSLNRTGMFVAVHEAKAALCVIRIIAFTTLNLG